MQFPTPAGPFEPVNVLVADDDPVQRAEFVTRLPRLNARAIEAADGSDAWDQLTRHAFDVAVVDLSMPNLDGFALIRCIRGYPRTRHVPIVVISSNSDSSSVAEAMQAGATSFLIKPIVWSMFEQHIGFLVRLIAQANLAEKAGLVPRTTLRPPLPQRASKASAPNRDRALPVAMASQQATMTRQPPSPLPAAAMPDEKAATVASAPAPTSAVDIIDIGCLTAFVTERSPERVTRTIGIFVEDLDKKADQLAGLVAGRTAAGLQMLAHSLIGSAATLGAARLARLAREIETVCRKGQVEDWAAVEGLLVTVRDTIAAFSHLKDREAIAAAVSRRGHAA